MAHKKSNQAKATAKKPHISKQILVTSALTGVLIVVLLTYTLYYADKVLPRTKAAGVLVSGKTVTLATESLQQAGEKLAAEPTIVKVEDKSIEVHAADIGLVMDAKQTARDAYMRGRRTDFLQSVADYIAAPFKDTLIPFVVTYDNDKLQKLVTDVAFQVDSPEVNAGVKIEDGKVIETQGVVGKRIKKDELQSALINAWQGKSLAEIKLNRYDVSPQISSGDTSGIVSQATHLRQIKFGLSSDKDTINAKQSSVDSWITSEIFEGKLRLALNKETVKSWLETVSPQVNSDAEEARLEMRDGKVTVFQPGKEGKVVNTDKTAEAFVAAVRDYVSNNKNDKQIIVSAVFDISKPVISNASIDSLGITELIGSGTTSFVGSPENRKHNIAVGAKALNGILLRPGEEFSTLKYLGKIDGAAGYLPELVIKVNTTEPEFGGGLCQVSTTLFRATMNSGLKVTERRNHRYRVGYYEPPVGMDATIYEGSPDYKFVNDTPSNILIQSHVEGTKITFEMYGKKDGRTTQLTDPVVYNTTTPPDPEYIQTDTLPEGTTKQTEKAHNGADASFTYTVLNGDGSVRNKQTFTSHYVPWRARFLVGTKKADPPAEPAP